MEHVFRAGSFRLVGRGCTVKSMQVRRVIGFAELPDEFRRAEVSPEPWHLQLCRIGAAIICEADSFADAVRVGRHSIRPGVISWAWRRDAGSA